MILEYQNVISAWLNNHQTIFPQVVSQHADLIVYLAPSILFAILIRYLSKRHPIFLLFLLTGTICHELGHLIIGAITGAKPASFSVIPRRDGAGGGWTLGTVGFTNLRWYNAAPAALAPFLILVVPLFVAYWRTYAGLHFELIDLALAVALAPVFLSFWPSRVDWKAALLSWPYLVFGGAVWWWQM